MNVVGQGLSFITGVKPEGYSHFGTVWQFLPKLNIATVRWRSKPQYLATMFHESMYLV